MMFGTESLNQVRDVLSQNGGNEYSPHIIGGGGPGRSVSFCDDVFGITPTGRAIHGTPVERRCVA